MLKQEGFLPSLRGVLFFYHTSSDLGDMLEIKISEGQKAIWVLLCLHLNENENKMKLNEWQTWKYTPGTLYNCAEGTVDPVLIFGTIDLALIFGSFFCFSMSWTALWHFICTTFQLHPVGWKSQFLPEVLISRNMENEWGLCLREQKGWEFMGGLVSWFSERSGGLESLHPSKLNTLV